MKIFRSGAIRHGVAPLWLLSYCCSILLPLQTFALTSGPSQPEVQAFVPATSSELVDLFTGDFKYNIPLMDVGGYPLNLSYNANISAEDEASWVGLGWTLNTGAVTRTTRGLPDDFSGDEVTKEYNVKPNQTFGVGASLKPEFFGLSWLDIGVGREVFYNTYTGMGSELSLSAGLSAGQKGKGVGTFGLGLDVSANSEKGLDVGISANYSNKLAESDKTSSSISGKIGLGYNSREGLKQLTFGADLKDTEKKETGARSSSFELNSGRISFAKPSYSPQIDVAMRSLSGSASLDLGTSAYGVDLMAGVKGYYSEQRVMDAVTKRNGYGYLYSHLAGSENTLYDINREKDGPYTQDMKSLPITNFTYDIFNVDAQGCNGSYRAHRSDVGAVGDPKTHSPSYSLDIKGPEIAAAVSVHGGIDINGSADFSESGKWTNSASSAYKFKGETLGQDFEPYYFKKSGELTVDNDTNWFNNDLGGFGATRLNIKKEGGDVELPASRRNQRNNRSTRASMFYFLSGEEAQAGALLKPIKSYDMNDFDQNIGSETIWRSEYPKHHISEVNVVETDGKRYVFGTPIYNTYQEEMSFNVKGHTKDELAGSTTYEPNKDNTLKNELGVDHFFSKTITPAFAHSFLLSAVLSHDYEDADAVPGPSDGDLGTYVKFNHTRAVKDYGWRTPYGENMASLNDLLEHDDDDDKGSIVYGKKDIWYLHSIETPTEIAEFYISKRGDGVDVADVNGAMGNNHLYKLDSLKLYSKASKLKSTNPEAIKTIHFVYDYSLCKGTPNTDTELNPEKGKLTLKKVFFTYGRSKRGAFNPYRFHYDLVKNHPYAAHIGDRWGIYKPNDASLTNAEYPYSSQNDGLANSYIASWAINAIELPNGGRLNIQYEADNYAYVQDRRAMQMFKVIGMGNSSSMGGMESEIYDPEGGGNGGRNDYLYFEIPSTPQYVNAYNANPSRFKELLFGKDSLVYFKFHVNVKKNNSDQKEYVPGYFTYDENDVGLELAAGTLRGYMKIDPVSLTGEGGRSVSPMTKAAVQFARIHMPREVFGQTDIHKNGILQVLEELFGIATAKNLFTNVSNVVNGENNIMVDEDAGRVFDNNGKSFIRLNNPIGCKFGGGHRVKRIELSDDWKRMTGNAEESFAYGQEYSYSTLDTDNKTEISSGVAAYEPNIGGEENPYKQPVFYTIDKLLAPSETYYHEEPFGESFFPSPEVGYSKITVRSLQHPNVKSNGTGFVVNEFFTAKDFPIITQKTGLDEIRVRPTKVSSFFKISQDDEMTVSQGYYVELNNMHGKPKAVYMYPQEGKAYVSATEYQYKQEKVTIPIEVGGNTVNYTINRLSNKVPILDEEVTNGNHRIVKTMGVEYDMVYDFRRSVSELTSAGARINLDVFIVIFPILVPAVYPKFDHEHTEFNSAVATKVVRRSAIVESVTQKDQGSIVTVSNELYDPYLGEALVTKTQNQYDTPVYTLKYPAHWRYADLGAGYQNIGRVFKDVNFSYATSEQFKEGDHVLLKDGGVLKRAVIVRPPTSAFLMALPTDGGFVVYNSEYVKIIRSSFRNRLQEKIGEVTTLSPIQIDRQINFNNVLQANMITYKNEWQRFCECDSSGAPNPMLRENYKVYYPEANYIYVTERKLTRVNNNLDLKTDGVFNDFVPFWWYNSGNNWQEASADKWRFSTAVTIRNGHGEELENVDYLGRYSSATFGYAQTMPTAVATNTPYAELAFDNFESYEMENCEDNHFNFKKAIKDTSWGATPNTYSGTNVFTNRSTGVAVTDVNAHTGRYSLKVPSGGSAMILKNMSECPPKLPDPPVRVVVK